MWFCHELSIMFSMKCNQKKSMTTSEHHQTLTSRTMHRLEVMHMANDIDDTSLMTTSIAVAACIESSGWQSSSSARNRKM